MDTGVSNEVEDDDDELLLDAVGLEVDNDDDEDIV